jgi:FMN reductase
MSSIVLVTGSPSPTSRSSFISAAVAKHASGAGIATRSFSIRDFDPGDVLFGRSDAPAVGEFLRAVAQASAIVLSTPVYKATYSGGLKSVVDLIPADGLIGKAALGIATARLAAHAQGVDRAYRDLFVFFRARGLDTLFLHDDQVTITDGLYELSAEAAGPVAGAVRSLLSALGIAADGAPDRAS